MVQNSRNSDNPEDKEYWEELNKIREDKRPFSILRKTDLDLAASQNHVCPICFDSLYNGEIYHRHHIIERSKGGSNTFSNLILLHLPCHYQVHNAKNEMKDVLFKRLTDFKLSHPRPAKDKI